MSVFFRNATAYRLPRPWRVSAEDLAAQLEEHVFVPTGQLEAQSLGWVAPVEGAGLVYECNGHYLIALRTEKRVMPASAVDLVVKERAAALAEKLGFRPGRKMMKELKELVTDEMLPQAFRQQRDTRVWLDPAAGMLVVDSATTGPCDAVMGLLAKSLAPFPVSPLYVRVSPERAMTRWLADEFAPDGFTIDTDVELRGAGEAGAIIRFQRQAIDATDVGRYMREGKVCTMLGLTWSDRVSFLLTDTLTIKRVVPLDVLTLEADRGARNDMDRIAADFTLMTGELRRLLANLIHALGGEDHDLVQAANEPATTE